MIFGHSARIIIALRIHLKKREKDVFLSSFASKLRWFQIHSYFRIIRLSLSLPLRISKFLSVSERLLSGCLSVHECLCGRTKAPSQASSYAPACACGRVHLYYFAHTANVRLCCQENTTSRRRRQRASPNRQPPVRSRSSLLPILVRMSRALSAQKLWCTVLHSRCHAGSSQRGRRVGGKLAHAVCSPSASLFSRLQSNRIRPPIVSQTKDSWSGFLLVIAQHNDDRVYLVMLIPGRRGESELFMGCEISRCEPATIFTVSAELCTGS